jgi:hypothetical protein
MPQTDKSVKAAAVMPESLKEKLKEYAESKRWTMSQAMVYLIEKGLEEEFENHPSQPTKRK